MWVPVWALAASAIASGAGCLVVDDDYVRVGDLHRVGIELQGLDPQTRFSAAPAAGMSKIVTAAEAGRFASLHGAALPEPREFCVERRGVSLTKELLLKALEGAVGDPEAVIEILDFSKRKFPPGELRFVRSGLSGTGGLSGAEPVLWRGLVVRPGSSTPVWVKARLLKKQTRIVAVAPLRAGASIRLEQIGRRTEMAFAFAPAALSRFDQVVGRRPRRLIRAGETLKPEALFPAREVEKGETVSASAISGEVQLRFEARAEAAGSRGEAIPLLNTATGKRVRGVVTGRGSVEIRTGPEQQWGPTVIPPDRSQ